MSVYLRTAINCGPCGADPCASGCASPPTPSLTYRSRSASLTKCGYAEYVPSTPPKIYLSRTLSGYLRTVYNSAIGCSGTCVQSDKDVYGGACTYDPATCVLSEGGYVEIRGGSCNCSDALIETDATCEISAPVGSTDTLTATTRTVTPDSTCVDSAVCGSLAVTQEGSAVETLSSEYTTSTLISETLTALSAATWTAFGAGSSSTLRDLSTDEMTFSLRATEIKFSFAAQIAAFYLRFEEWFTPEGGVAALFSSVCVTISPGATEYIWPITIPSSDGEIAIFNTTTSCTPC